MISTDQLLPTIVKDFNDNKIDGIIAYTTDDRRTEIKEDFDLCIDCDGVIDAICGRYYKQGDLIILPWRNITSLQAVYYRDWWIYRSRFWLANNAFSGQANGSLPKEVLR